MKRLSFPCSGFHAAAVRVVACVAALLAFAPAYAQEEGLLGKGALSGPAAADTDDEVAAAKPLQIKAVELGGIERVDEQAVRNQIRVKAGSPLDPVAIADDVRRIFAMGLFDDVRVGLKKVDANAVVVRYQMLERPSIAAIQILGNDAQSEEDVLKVVDLRVNNLYSAAEAAANATKIKEMYADEGYFLATVRHRAEPQPGNQVKVVFEIQERAEVKVRHIDLLGNEGVTDADIKAVLRTQEGSILGIISKSGNFKREMLEYDLQVIQYLYLTRGYIQAKVDEPVVSLSPDMKYISIAIRVHEGPQFKVRKVDVTGDSVEPLETLKARLNLKSGDIFNYAHVQSDMQKLSGAQKNFGYAHATVSNESVPDVDGRLVDWTYHIQKGKKVYFGQILMQGGGSTRDKVIRRELAIAEGQLYSEAKLNESQARVQRLGFFEKVDIKTRSTALPQVLDVVVEVKERTTGTFQVGMGFSSVDNFITTAQIAKDNFLGRGQRMSVQISWSSARKMFQGSFFEPYFLDTNFTFSLDLAVFDQLYPQFTRKSTGGGMSWGYRLTDELHAEAGYNVEDVDILIGGQTGRSNVSISGLFEPGLTSSVRTTLSFDSRDDRMFPTSGWYLSATAESALDSIGSDFQFARFTTRLRRYFPLPLEGVLKFNLVGGYIRTLDNRPVPVHERFFHGGIDSQRGFVRHSLGPSIDIPSANDPAATLEPFKIGGTKKLYLNNEIEIPILKAPMNLRGLVFFDIGNAFGERDPITPDTMRMSFGWGVRWFSPVGPLRFEWGVPINPRDGEDKLVFEFTIGNSF